MDEQQDVKSTDTRDGVTTIADHATYIREVERLIRCSENSWSWTDTPEVTDEEIEISDAAIAVGAYMDMAESGRAGVISMPGAIAFGWHERDGWEYIDRYGHMTPIGVAPDASPEVVARAASRF
ncbi:hypothetical protein ACFXKD_13690 [Nocardiopsis aegyptia]|uniref:hypothetical protein n=1 Tax=Nocardiopsis aegyptia TaxID=220378 RepID=UPI0036720CA9